MYVRSLYGRGRRSLAPPAPRSIDSAWERICFMVTATKVATNHMPKETTPAKAAKKQAKEPAATSPFDANTDLKNTLAQIEKQFGEGAIMPLGSGAAVKIEGIPTGSLSLDMALGGQGIPKGRIVEIFGPESSGKTTLALHVVAQAQKAGGIAAFIDAEHALDPSWAKKLGVELETLLVSQPGSGEEAMHITEMLIKLERGRRDRDRLGGRPGSQEGIGRRHRRFARRPASPADEPVDAQADRRDFQEQNRGDLHQPDPRKDRRHVRQSRNDPRRPGAEVLLLLPDRRAADRATEGRRGSGRPAGAGQGGQKQSRPAVPPGRI